jgi:hypothetical protein
VPLPALYTSTWSSGDVVNRGLRPAISTCPPTLAKA